MALLAPFFLLWPDIRILYFIQVVGYAVAGLILYCVVADRRPHLAPWFLLAFYLNPTLHDVVLYELRRITLAVPYLALAVYALYKDERKLLLIAVFFALLTKEEIGILVAGIG